MLRFRVLPWLIVCLLVVAPLLLPAAPVYAVQDDAAATRVLGLINQFRIEQGLWPLRVHPSLQAMAEAQAAYIFPNRANIIETALSGYHKDAQGRDARTRAYEIYNWPPYGRPDRVEAGENAAEFPVERAFEFWIGSTIHRSAVLSLAYREAGIAAIPIPNRPNSFLFYMTFGGRPNVLPVLVDPVNGWLLLSADRSRYAANRDWTDIQVQLLDARREPLGEPVRWSRTLKIPANVQGTMYVQFNGPGVSVTTAVNLTTDVAILPGTFGLISAAQQSAAVAAVERQPTAIPTSLVAAPSMTPTRSAITGSIATTPPTVTAVATGAILVTTSLPPNPTIATAREADVTLIYNAGGLVLRNTAAKPLDLTTLQVGTTTMAQWLRVANFPAGAFPVNHCVQVVRGNSTPPTVPQCRFMRSEVQSNNAYWALGTFDVRYNGEVVQTCEPSAGKCEIDLP